ncbi:unnamed protein product, partial [Pylaiella littoralis]
MVHLLNDSRSLKNGKVNRKRREHGDAGKEGRSAENPTLEDEQEEKGEKGRYVDQVKRKGTVAASSSRRSKRCKSTIESPQTTEISLPPSRTTEEAGLAPGLAPSGEIRLLRQARESAQ